MAYEEIIESAAKEYKIDPKLIRAIITVESSWNANAKRYEANVKDYSYGLMQVRLATARWVSGNPKLTPAQLIQPTVNILIGTKYLRELANKYPRLDDVIASYNAGSPIRSKLTGKYINQGYVDKVKRALYGVQITGFPTLALLVGFVAVAGTYGRQNQRVSSR